MRRRALMGASGNAGLSAVLTPNDITRTNIMVFNYILANSTTDSQGSKDWFPRETDDIVITGTFQGNVLNRAKVLNAYRLRGDMFFTLEWEGQSIWHYGYLYQDGMLDMGDDS